MSRPWKLLSTRPGGREIGLMLGGGLMLGLTIAAAFALSAGAPDELDLASVEVPDRWQESRKSRQELEPQEGSPWGQAEAAAPVRLVMAGSVRVIDGDTFDFGGERIRIADIDTPEVRGRCPYETELAARATGRMRELLNLGPFEMNPIERDEDRYGRKLRVVTRNGRSLGDVLVAEGLARTWSGRREPWC